MLKNSTCPNGKSCSTDAYFFHNIKMGKKLYQFHTLVEKCEAFRKVGVRGESFLVGLGVMYLVRTQNFPKD